jgi:hypothetical protein
MTKLPDPNALTRDDKAQLGLPPIVTQYSQITHRNVRNFVDNLAFFQK